MSWRVYLVESVSKYSHRLVTIFQSIVMCADVYAVCQSADDEYIRTHSAQVADKPTYEVLSVSRAASCSYYVYNVLLIQVSSTFVVQYDRCISTFSKSFWVVGILNGDCFDVALLNKLHLYCRSFQCLVPVTYCLTKMLGAVRHYITDIISVLINLLAAPQCVVQLQSYRQVKACHACQRNAIEYLFVVHHSFVTHFSNARS